MDPAVAALSGALLSGAVAMLSVWIANRAHREQSRREMVHATIEANRNERRRVYADFLDSLTRWRYLSHDFALFAAGVVPESGDIYELVPRYQADDFPEVHRPAAIALEAQRDELWDKWRKTLTEVELLGSPMVAQWAKELFQRYSSVFNQAWEKLDLLPGFDDEEPTEEDLLEQMRADLGLPRDE
jgi:hypothetical protein